MINFFRSLLPGTTPAYLKKSDELLILRERILQLIALYLAGFGIITLIVTVRDAVITDDFVSLIVYVIVFSATLLIAVFRTIPYRLRSFLLLSVVFASSVFSMYEYGLGGNARIFMFTMSGLAGIFLGVQAGGVGLFVSIITMVLFAAGMVTGFIPAPPLGANADPRNLADWILAIVYFTLLASTVSMSTGSLVRGMDATLKKQQETARELEKERESLEGRVQERTDDMMRRLTQLRTAVEVVQSVSSLLDPQELLQRVVTLLQERMNLYYAGIFLVDEYQQYAVLRAGTGEAGRRMLAAGHRLQIGGSSMIGWTVSNQKARIALDVGQEAVRFNNPVLPLTRSELAIPIRSSGKALGAMTIQSTQPNAFDDADIMVFQGVADSVAVAIENARLFQQTQQNLDEIRALNQQYLGAAWTEMVNIHGRLQYSYENPSGSTGNEMSVPITLRDQVIGRITLSTAAGQLSEEERQLVEAITTQTALALESARLLEETQRRALQEEKVNTLTTQFSRAISIEEILKIALTELGQLPSVSEVAVHLLPQEQSADNGENGHKQLQGVA